MAKAKEYQSILEKLEEEMVVELNISHEELITAGVFKLGCEPFAGEIGEAGLAEIQKAIDDFCQETGVEFPERLTGIPIEEMIVIHKSALKEIVIKSLGLIAATYRIPASDMAKQLAFGKDQRAMEIHIARSSNRLIAHITALLGIRIAMAREERMKEIMTSQLEDGSGR